MRVYLGKHQKAILRRMRKDYHISKVTGFRLGKRKQVFWRLLDAQLIQSPQLRPAWYLTLKGWKAIRLGYYEFDNQHQS